MEVFTAAWCKVTFTTSIYLLTFFNAALGAASGYWMAKEAGIPRTLCFVIGLMAWCQVAGGFGMGRAVGLLE